MYQRKRETQVKTWIYQQKITRTKHLRRFFRHIYILIIIINSSITPSSLRSSPEVIDYCSKQHAPAAMTGTATTGTATTAIHTSSTATAGATPTAETNTYNGRGLYTSHNNINTKQQLHQLTSLQTYREGRGDSTGLATYTSLSSAASALPAAS